MRTHQFSNYHSLLNLALNAAAAQHEKLLEEIAEFKKNSKELNEQEKQIHLHQCGTQLEQSRIVVALLSCSFIEALANFYISLKCKSAQFEILERASLLDKWTTIPSLFVPEYQFPKGRELFRQLKTLTDTRNRISHSKPEIVTDGKVVHKGFLPKIPESGVAFVKTSAELPLQLVKHLLVFDKSGDVFTLLMTSGFPFQTIKEIADKSIPKNTSP